MTYACYCGVRFDCLESLTVHQIRRHTNSVAATEPAAKTTTKTASDFLNDAAELLTERGKTYDQEGGERSMGKCVVAFNAITGRGLSEAEGWLLLQLLKDVRQWSRADFHQDSAEDCISYAALKAECLANT